VILSEGIDPVDCLASPFRISLHRSFGQRWGLVLSKRTLVHFSMLVSGLDQRSPFFNRLGTDLSVNANKVLKGLDFYNLYLRIFRNPPVAIFETGAAFTSNTLGMTKYGTCSQDSDVIKAGVRLEKAARTASINNGPKPVLKQRKSWQMIHAKRVHLDYDRQGTTFQLSFHLTIARNFLATACPEVPTV
jgi:hypothetical protein